MLQHNNKNEILKEITRVEAAIANTSSEYLKRDYGKYLKRLQAALRRCYR